MKYFGVAVFFTLVIIVQQLQIAQENVHKSKTSFNLYNIPYTNDCDSLQMVDVFLPIKEEPSPVIVFFHGGGWIHGDKSAYRELGKKLASDGIICIIANYRLSPKVKHPAHIQDLSSAVKWVWNNINNLGGDSTRIYLAGHSAGAHLATLLVTNEKYLLDKGMSIRNIAGVICISGVYLIAPNPKGATEEFIKSIFGDSSSIWREASPIYNIQENNQKLPKLLVAWYKNENNLIVQENENWVRKLNQFKYEFETVIIGGSDHAGFYETLGNEDDELTDQIYKFIGIK